MTMTTTTTTTTLSRFATETLDELGITLHGLHAGLVRLGDDEAGPYDLATVEAVERACRAADAEPGADLARRFELFHDALASGPQPAIPFNTDGESPEYVATRPVRNSDHSLGTIEEGAAVFFRLGEDGVTLAYAVDGRPTNGSEYVTFATVEEAAAFASRARLVPAVELLRQAIEASGLSARRYAVEVLIRDERTVRRWLAGDEIPAVVVTFLLRYLAEQGVRP